MHRKEMYPEHRKTKWLVLLSLMVMLLFAVSPAQASISTTIIAAPTSGQSPLSVSLSNQISGTETGVLWVWDFGDGSSQTLTTNNGNLTSPHTYTASKLYTVTLTVSGNSGSVNSATTVISVSPAPSFNIANSSVWNAPLTVTFTDTSLGAPFTNWQWQFGDGSVNVSGSPSTSHIYQNAGVYQVNLTITGQNALSASTSRIVYVRPLADFIASPLGGNPPLTVQFTDLSTGSPDTWNWNFGNSNATSVQQHPSYTFTNPGTYTITLTSIGRNQVSTPMVKTAYIVVGQSPVASFTASPISAGEPLTVSFTDASSGVPPLTYNWDFGDSTSNSTNANPVHTYSTYGNYTATLTVVDGRVPQNSASFQRVISVLPLAPPVVDFHANATTIYEGDWVQFYDDSTNNPTSWIWWVNGYPFSNLQSPSVLFTTPGQYTVALQASNARGTSEKIKVQYIYVMNIPPVANFSATPLSGPAPLSVQFTDLTVGNGKSIWYWDFGDTATQYYYTPTNPIHVYNNAGIYSVALQVYNDGGWSTPAIKMNYINVTAPIPVSPNTITLYNGWNFVSTPKKLVTGNSTFGQVFGNVQLAGHSILLYNTTTSLWQSMGQNNEIKPLDGYWIWSNAPSPIQIHLIFTGDIFPQSKALYTGWNAIGFSGTTQASASDFLSPLGVNWDRVIGYYEGSNPEIAIIRTSSDPAFSPSRLMKPTHGYWILMNNQGTLQGLA
jgi:PKD repeat protein